MDRDGAFTSRRGTGEGVGSKQEAVGSWVARTPDFGIRGFVLTLLTKRSDSIGNSLFPTRYSPFPVPCSLLPVPCSLFPVPCSLILGPCHAILITVALRRGVRVAEGARLESVFTRNRDVGSNPTLSATLR